MSSSMHVFHAYLPEDNSSQPPNLVPTKDKNGCWICRFRKKTCKTYDENGPDYDANDKSCYDCRKFNIVCCGQGLDRPSRPGICESVRTKTREWISNKLNRRTCVPSLDLSYLWPGEIGAFPSGDSLPSPPDTPSGGTSPLADLSDILPPGAEVVQPLFSSSTQFVPDFDDVHIGEQIDSEFTFSFLNDVPWLATILSQLDNSACEPIPSDPSQSCLHYDVASEQKFHEAEPLYDYTDTDAWSPSWVLPENVVPALSPNATTPSSEMSSVFDAPTPSSTDFPFQSDWCNPSLAMGWIWEDNANSS